MSQLKRGKYSFSEFYLGLQWIGSYTIKLIRLDLL
jgi:hypothetical protein